MNYLKITPVDTANGPGCRVTLWVSGCLHHCEGCHNPETWWPGAGQLYTEETEKELMRLLEPKYIRGLTISGGDPLYPENRVIVERLVRRVREVYPEKDIWLYTGYTAEQVMDWVDGDRVDVLVDGQFVKSQKDISLRFRGSRNQRLIDARKSREYGCIVLWKDDPQFDTHEMV